jgi:hypothetical protein
MNIPHPALTAIELLTLFEVAKQTEAEIGGRWRHPEEVT